MRFIKVLLLVYLLAFDVIVYLNILSTIDNDYQVKDGLVTTPISIKRDQRITLYFLGDIMFSRGVKKWVLDEGRNPFEFINFKNISSNKPDLIIGNLEGPITDSTECQKKAYSFRFASSTAFLLKNNDINLVSLANNHTFDCFNKGLMDTREYLTETGIGFFGGVTVDESYTSVVVKGKSIAFIGVDMTIEPVKIEEIYQLVEKTKLTQDYIVVFMHWGTEYAKQPNTNQEETAKKLIDIGADAVIGSHPHVTQTVEIYKNKPIIYSLGNFIFDQTILENTKGYIAELVFTEKGIKYNLYPYTINMGQPVLDN